jgi:hypothetical protein
MIRYRFEREAYGQAKPTSGLRYAIRIRCSPASAKPAAKQSRRLLRPNHCSAGAVEHCACNHLNLRRAEARRRCQTLLNRGWLLSFDDSIEAGRVTEIVSIRPTAHLKIDRVICLQMNDQVR